jgi:ABC-2 type transport system ATP-binding protein
MIEAQHLTKRYGTTVAVDEASFAVRPGRVTGFLGPNGAGKSTTMRMILGLDTPSSGSVLVNGKPYRELTDPLRSVGALLDAGAIVGGRSAASHLAWLDGPPLSRAAPPGRRPRGPRRVRRRHVGRGIPPGGAP